MQVLVFELWGDYGHFRKFYTTSSPLTFSFPPPSTVAGILGAVYGAGKEEYLRLFGEEKCRIAVGIRKAIKKTRIGINLIDTKKSWWNVFQNRTQIRTEFVKEPLYRIYLTHQDAAIFNRLAEKLAKHQTTFTVSLGLSELLADWRYLGVFEAKANAADQAVEISSVIPADKITPKGFVIEAGRKYFKERMPLMMDSQRVVQRWDEVIFEVQGKTINALLRESYALENGENIALL